MRIISKFILVLLTIQSLTGCITMPYHYSDVTDLNGVGENGILEPGELQISRGEPNVIADGLGHLLFSLPEKLILWNWSMGNHDISPTTEKAITDFLAANNLKEVKFRLNEYAPLNEWHRLTHNYAVGAGWRYTVGVITWLYYTILPGRIFGGDAYNPYTNSVYLYSDIPVVALHECGHARYTAQSTYKGTQAILRIFPLLPLFDEYNASTDAMTYIHQNEMPSNEKRAYKTLYPAFGTYIGGEALRAFPGSSLIGAAFAIPGHIVGRIKSSGIAVEEGTSEQIEINSFDKPKLAEATNAQTSVSVTNGSVP